MTITPMTTFELIYLALTAFSALFIFWQVRILQRTFKADHERRKKQSTLEAVDRADEKFLPIYARLNQKFQGIQVDPNKLDNSTWDEIDDLLTPLEYLAVGVNSGIYDDVLVLKLCGHFLISIYHQLSQYIVAARVKTHNPYCYGEFQAMCARLEALDQEFPPTRDIDTKLKYG
jgi:hypothetical protein